MSRVRCALLGRNNTEGLIFGSRARGDKRYNSDIDIALEGNEIPLRINARLKKAAGLYSIDIVRLSEVDNDDLLRSITRDGVVLYVKR